MSAKNKMWIVFIVLLLITNPQCKYKNCLFYVQLF